MKAYKFEFKVEKITNPLAAQKQSVDFKYAQTLREALTIPTRDTGLTTDELLQSVTLCGKLDEADAEAKDYILIDEKQYEYIKTKVNEFRWSFAHIAIANFINYVRELPLKEVDLKT